MDKNISDRFITWLRRKHPGTVVKVRDFILHLVGPLGAVPLTATLSIRVFRKGGDIEDHGIVSTHVVTDAFVAELVDALQAGGVAAFDDYKYHDSGTGVNVEAAADTALQTPCGEARDVGTQIEGATANIYKSVGTNTYAGAFAITEHGLFNAAVAGTLMDRSVFSAITVASGDKIEFTYELTGTSGG